ncbi:hypothetical protein KA107_01600 [Candidatus Pacearchaeota archaeon]|nr:hypothetical protein [Candidatus Pacearchaeota archaeon]
MFETKKDSTTKDQIINILGYEWPLSAKKIYFLLKRKHRLTISYQAVYKAIQEMCDDKILQKTKKDYQLDLTWVKKVHDETDMIRVNYYAIQKAAILEGKGNSNSEIKILAFKTWFDMEKYLYYLQKNSILGSTKKEDIFFCHSHEWRPLFYLRAEYNWIKKLTGQGNRIYTLCSGNTLIDKTMAKFYSSAGSNILLNSSYSEEFETMVYQDNVINIYLPNDLRKLLNDYFSCLKNMGEIDFNYLIQNIFEKECQIKVIVNKDAELATQIKKQLLSRFKA